MNELAFRDAREADIAAILALGDAGRPPGVDAAPSDPQDPAYAQAFARIDADPSHRLIVGEQDGLIVGTLQVSIIPGLPRRGLTRGLLENVHVHPDRRGQGIGAAMIDWAIKECRAAGCGLVQLTSDKRRPDAHRLYRRLGFEATHDGFKLFL